MFQTPWLCGVIVCVALAVAAAGCASSLPTQEATPATTSVATSPATLTSAVTSIPATAAAPSPDDAARKALDDTWKAIRITWDDYVEDVDELGGVAASNQDKNHIREKIIPDTIGRYRALSANVSAVIATDADLVAEKTVLVAICGYKVRQLEGMESYYHAAQIETYDAKKGKDEYRNAKYTLQDALDAINALNVYTLANPSRYSTYVYDDKGDIEDAIDEITSHIARL